jgi:hypothetical protein
MSKTTVPSPVPRVDARAARLSQALVAALVALALVLRAPALLAVVGIHLALSAALGRRGNVAIRLFDVVLRPRLGPPAWEDARPPRFANLLGATVILLALAAHAAGAATLGWGLAALVGTLSLIATSTGACVGCWLYGYLGPFRGLVRWIG